MRFNGHGREAWVTLRVPPGLSGSMTVTIGNGTARDAANGNCTGDYNNIRFGRPWRTTWGSGNPSFGQQTYQRTHRRDLTPNGTFTFPIELCDGSVGKNFRVGWGYVDAPGDEPVFGYSSYNPAASNCTSDVRVRPRRAAISAGMVTQSFGGRSYTFYQPAVPERPRQEVTVSHHCSTVVTILPAAGSLGGSLDDQQVSSQDDDQSAQDDDQSAQDDDQSAQDDDQSAQDDDQSAQDDDQSASVCTPQLPSDAVTVSEVTGWRGDYGHGAHVSRWNRVLAALGEDTGEAAMTVEQAQAIKAQFDNSRWDRTVRTLQALGQCADAP